jgi:large subunit ribosomal protein L46
VWRRIGSTRAYSSIVEEAKQGRNGPNTPNPNILAGLILSRVPIVTPELTSFEKSYYRYQDELERRLMWTFPSYYYFKKGSLRERQFNTAQRGPVARQLGVFYPRGLPDIQHNRERRFKQEIVIPRQDAGNDALFGSDKTSDDSLSRPIVPNSRTTEADNTNDITSLIRKLDRTLYLVVKSPYGWQFPAFSLNQKEPLHVAAERGLREFGGVNINTWTVSNTPSGVLRYNNEAGKRSITQIPSDSTIREFFISSHILHGQFVPQNGQEFGWLTKNEIAEKVDPLYFEVVGPLLSEQ